MINQNSLKSTNKKQSKALTNHCRGLLTEIRAISIAVCLLLAALVIGCGSDLDAPEDVPDNHSVLKGGAVHAPGFQTPSQSCTDCHGVDLEGGENGEPSCFSCHGKEWP